MMFSIILGLAILAGILIIVSLIHFEATKIRQEAVKQTALLQRNNELLASINEVTLYQAEQLDLDKKIL